MSKQDNSYQSFIVKTLVVSLSFSILVGTAAYVFLSKKQTYTASTNIKFVNTAASEGYAWDGSKIEDVLQEITGSEVIDVAISDNWLQGKVTSNVISKSITIESVIPDEEQDKIDSALDNGKEYEYNPVEYRITINSDLPQAGKILNSMIKNFFEYYEKNYVSPDSFPSNVSLLIQEDTTYDYIEQADLIRSNIEEIEAFLATKAESYSDYHDSTNGYSFSNLNSKYEYIYNTKLPKLYATILANKASKNPELLLKKLGQENSAYSTNNENTNEDLEKILSLITSYSEKNTAGRTVTNGNLDGSLIENHTSIIEGLYENTSNPQSSYDQLFNTLISELDAISANNTSISYNDYLKEAFSGASPLADAAVATEIETLISDILTELNDLYTYANVARTEHLGIESTSMIVQLNTPISQRQLNVKMYTLLAAIATFLLTVVAIPVVKIFMQNLYIFITKKQKEDAELLKELENK